MINSVKLTNFRRHRDANFQFMGGMNVIRGPNESSKSTIIEAVSYAMFGVKTLRSSLEDTVTHGSPVGTLRVDLSITIDGVDYEIRRSKSGCECNYAGGVVTGQTEVSNFIAKLLRVDAASAARLMVSPQSEIRGALEAGPKATTEMIERLSDFDQIDHLIEVMQEKLTLGNTAAASARVDAARERLDRAKAVVEPPFATLAHAVAVCKEQVEAAEKAHEDACTLHTRAVQEHAAAKAAASELRSLETRRLRALRELSKLTTELDILSANPKKAPADAEAQIQSILAAKGNVANAIATSRVYKQFQEVPPTTLRFPGGAEAWAAEVGRVRAEIEKLRRAQGDMNGRMHMLKAQLSLGTCSFCGQDFSEVPEVKAKNAQVQEDIKLVEFNQANAAAQVEELQKQLDELEAIQTQGRPTLAFLQKNGQYLETDDSVYPPILKWKGSVPQDMAVIPDYDEQIERIRIAIRAATAYQRDLEVNEAAVKIASAELEAVKKRSSEIGATEDEAKTAEKVHSATEWKVETAEQVRITRQSLQNMEREENEAKRQWAWAQKEVYGTQIELNAAVDALKELEFNNALLKKVRATRPIISDRLWSVVLMAVSSYFSDIRGVRSRVTKDTGGFLVDEHPVTTLSGSTLDALGLAIRVALVRTFLPAASFLVLDEPAAAMDGDRTSNMLGFLAQCGYTQTILITHEDVSETVADHVINLGE